MKPRFRNTWRIERLMPWGWVTVCIAGGRSSVMAAWDRIQPDLIKSASYRITRPDGSVFKTSPAVDVDDDKIRQAWLEAKADLAKTAKEIEEGGK